MQDGEGKRVVWQGFGYLLASQVITRMVTFTVNVLVARTLAPDDYGVFAVQFHLITTGILFVAREGFRRGCLLPEEDTRSDGSEKLKNSVGVSWMCVPYGWLVSWVVCRSVVAWRGDEANDDYSHAVSWLGMAAALELLSEPAYILVQNMMLFNIRVAVETSATIVKSFLLYAMLAADVWPTATVFAYAQVAFGVSVLIGHLIFFGTSAKGRKMAPHLLPCLSLAPLRSSLSRLSLIFTIQSLEKLVLAEGEKMVMVMVESNFNQGVYGLVSNLGSLVVRTLYQPFEEAAFTSFRKYSCAEGDKHVQNTHTQQTLGPLLTAMLRAMLIVGSMFATFGPSYSGLLLHILYGSTWSRSEAPTVLGYYCFYIFLLGANGILEAFMHGVMNPSELSRSNAWLVLFSIVHIGASGTLVVHFGATGLVVANCLNMALRIAYACSYIAGFFGSTSALSEALPSRDVVLMCGLFGTGTCVWKKVFMMDNAGLGLECLGFVALGAVLFSSLAGVIYMKEKHSFAQIRHLRKKAD